MLNSLEAKICVLGAQGEGLVAASSASAEAADLRKVSAKLPWLIAM